MHVVRRDDGHRLDAVRAPGFGLRHLLEVGIDALGSEAEFLAGGLGLLRLGRQRARHEVVVIVHARGKPVHGADEGALPAAHHAEADAARVLLSLRSGNHGLRPYLMPRIRSDLAPCRPTPATKSSKDFSVTLMMWLSMKGAPSMAPCTESLRQHSHSSTAQQS